MDWLKTERPRSCDMGRTRVSAKIEHRDSRTSLKGLSARCPPILAPQENSVGSPGGGLARGCHGWRAAQWLAARPAKDLPIFRVAETGRNEPGGEGYVRTVRPLLSRQSREGFVSVARRTTAAPLGACSRPQPARRRSSMPVASAAPAALLATASEPAPSRRCPAGNRGGTGHQGPWKA